MEDDRLGGAWAPAWKKCPGVIMWSNNDDSCRPLNSSIRSAGAKDSSY